MDKRAAGLSTSTIHRKGGSWPRDLTIDDLVASTAIVEQTEQEPLWCGPD
jgi:hypothetical protein